MRLNDTQQKLKLIQLCNDRFDINLLKTNEYNISLKRLKMKLQNKVSSLDQKKA